MEKKYSKNKPAYTLNMPAFVKRVRKALDNKTIAILDKNYSATACYYEYADGTNCVIGSGLPKTVIAELKDRDRNGSGLSELIEDGLIKVPEKFKDRLLALQDAHDNEDVKGMRSKFRHLEASVKKQYPASFAA